MMHRPLLLLALLAISLSGCTTLLPDAPPATTLLAPVAAPSETAASPQVTDAPPTSTQALPPTETPAVTEVPPPTVTTIPIITRIAYGPRDFPPGVNPLTGLVVADPRLLERRPIVIKVTNFPRSVRPQSGLSFADHVYEYYIADDMSRFVGVFYGQDALQVGPIRSARLFDAHVTRMYDGIFIFGWADDIVLQYLFAPDLKPHLIVERPDNCPPLCRIGPQDAYNTLFADTTQIAAYLAKRRTSNGPQDLSGLRFEDEAPPSGSPADQVSIQYSGVSFHRWEYDPLQARYLRFQETGEGDSLAPLLDSLNGVQLSADNLLVLLVPHQFYKKSSSTEMIDQPFMGQGRGYAFRDGLIYPLRWQRDEADQLPTLTLPDGGLYPLKPGVTWVELLGETSAFEDQGAGAWGFKFSMP